MTDHGLDLAIIGNGSTSALVDPTARLVWWCYPRFDSDPIFSRLLAGALSLTFFVYVFVNAGMVSGLLPIVGVPLPLVSAGGTSMVTIMAGFGMLASIHGHRKLLAA